jgi:protein associated with RNAse G/E
LPTDVPQYRHKVRASVGGLEQIIDVGEFRRCPEEMEKKEALDKELKETVLVLLEAWRKQETGNDRQVQIEC